MPKTKIQIVILGSLPPGCSRQALLEWKSNLFEISPEIPTFQLNQNATGHDWEYTDQQIEGFLRQTFDCDILLIVVRVRLQDNWYLRRLSYNRLLFTFFELDQILHFHNIPLNNIILRVLYAGVLIYLRCAKQIPPSSEGTLYAHDETRGCLFDMNPNKWDVIQSLHQPSLCESCVAQHREAQVSEEQLRLAAKELKNIKRPLVDQIVRFVKAHTACSIIVSLIVALLIGTASSLIAIYLNGVL